MQDQADQSAIRKQGHVHSGVRAVLRRRPKIAAALAAMMIVVASGYLTWFFWPPPRFPLPTRAWYTVDDGATRFDDDAERIPPFDHDGRPAVRLHLFSCDGGKTSFVGYLQKLPDETMKHYRELGIDPATVDDDQLAAFGGWLAKRPGSGNWVNSRTECDAFAAVVSVHCPDGGAHSLEEIFPPEPVIRK